MNIETTEDLCNQIADWIGVYGCCKSAAEGHDECQHEGNPLCCRVNFVMVLQERMVEAVENDKKLEQAGL